MCESWIEFRFIHPTSSRRFRRLSCARRGECVARDGPRLSSGSSSLYRRRRVVCTAAESESLTDRFSPLSTTPPVEFSPFYGIEKGLVLQETRVFNEAQVDPRKCQQVITKLLYLLTQGETFTKAESSDVFFSVTKLFMHKDFHLRRMVYLCIK